MKQGDYIVLWELELGAVHLPTGKTTHYHGGAVLPAPSSLRIAQYPGDSGYYLLYLDAFGEELTDTYHDDLASAMAQAEWEFGAKPSEWAAAKL
jgi:hypothetical protein